MANTKPGTEKKSRKLLFRLMILLFPLFIIIIIELLLRVFSVGNNMHLFVKHHNKDYKEYYRVNPLIGEKYFNKFDATGATNDIFLRKKPENGFRIFVLGSSTVVGFPYENNLMFSRILQKRLQDSYPDKNIEVVNTAITAINSITLNDYMREIVHYSPDAIIFYEGQNEFYGAFGIGSNETLSRNAFVRNLHFRLLNLRFYQVLRKGIGATSKLFSKKPDIANARGSLMKKMVADKQIVYKGDTYNYGLDQFRTNLGGILKRCANHDIPVFLSDLVTNVRDLPPFGSADSEKFPRADATYKLAIETLNAGDTIKARELFYLAKDLDPVRFRASEDINLIIDSLAVAYNCYFVPTKDYFMNASVGKLIGNNLLTEHVHPNINGQFIMADAFYNSIVESKLIAAEVNPFTTRMASFYRNTWGYTELDSLMGVFRINQLKSYWPFNSFENNTTFRDTLTIRTVVDSLAFKVITSSFASGEKLHEYLANDYFKKGNYSEAIKEYNAILCINPYWYENYNKAADCYLKLDDLYAAEIALKNSLKYKQTYYANLMLAEIEILKHNFEMATENLRRAISLAEENQSELLALQKLYSLLLFQNNEDELTIIAKYIKKLDGQIPSDIPDFSAYRYSTYLPYNVKPIILKAAEKLKNSEVDAAIGLLVKSLEINDTPIANRLIGDALYQKKNNELLFFYTKAYQTYKYEPGFLSKFCVANYVNKNYSEASKALDDLKALQPDFKEIPGLEQMLSRIKK